MEELIVLEREIRAVTAALKEMSATAVEAGRVSSGMAAAGTTSTGGMGSATGTPQDGPAVTTGGLTMALRSLKGRTP